MVRIYYNWCMRFCRNTKENRSIIRHPPHTHTFLKLPTVLTFFCYVIYERSQGKARQGDGWGCWFIFGAVSWDPPKKPGADVTGIHTYATSIYTGLTAYKRKHKNLWNSSIMLQVSKYSMYLIRLVHKICLEICI